MNSTGSPPQKKHSLEFRRVAISSDLHPVQSQSMGFYPGLPRKKSLISAFLDWTIILLGWCHSESTRECFRPTEWPSKYPTAPPKNSPKNAWNAQKMGWMVKHDFSGYLERYIRGTDPRGKGKSLRNMVQYTHFRVLTFPLNIGKSPNSRLLK
jgi:hypothetical protein